MYQDMFCLDIQSLSDKANLDVPSGPSTFLSTLKKRGELHEYSRSVDLLYGNYDEIVHSLEWGMEIVFAPFYDLSYRAWPESVQASFLGLFNSFTQIQVEFLDAYSAYSHLFIQGDICNLNLVLPTYFKYDLILSANLLFLYASKVKNLNEDFHFKAIKSMLAHLKDGGQLNIFPLETFAADVPPFPESLVSRLKNEKFTVSIQEGCTSSVGQRLQGKANLKGKMLVIQL